MSEKNKDDPEKEEEVKQEKKEEAPQKLSFFKLVNLIKQTNFSVIVT